ncbi:hypothetical protein CYLTODRAFT_479575 [Cylindrobasidium torrendii FP15055 ss-10]|uniref:Uncharacterized protein n=1 Tax=Cylindrobasidium torrendii FP15055 ss-10 TaxID=1314674 RepID=A0A0D7AVB6_9AGAR|nr:hypothetical protein CYLTODRAFT_479575 [Cylindrobasidium torrendii FP15055 ss-10]
MMLSLSNFFKSKSELVGYTNKAVELIQFMQSKTNILAAANGLRCNQERAESIRAVSGCGFACSNSHDEGWKSYGRQRRMFGRLHVLNTVRGLTYSQVLEEFTNFLRQAGQTTNWVPGEHSEAPNNNIDDDEFEPEELIMRGPLPTLAEFAGKCINGMLIARQPLSAVPLTSCLDTAAFRMLHQT